MNKIDFLKTAVREYRIVGAITPSSRYVVRRIREELGSEYAYVVEYGAGDGVITKEILRGLSLDGRCVAIEMNHQFINELKRIPDSRLVVLGSDVRFVLQDVSCTGLLQIDAVVSGLPFSHMSVLARNEIVAKTHALLRPGGRYVVYGNAIITPLTYGLLKKYFSGIRVGFEPLNIPPYFIIIATK